jgi:hypothetical protein
MLTKSASCWSEGNPVAYRVGRLPAPQQADLVSPDGGAHWKYIRSAPWDRSAPRREFASPDLALAALEFELTAEIHMPRSRSPRYRFAN